MEYLSKHTLETTLVVAMAGFVIYEFFTGKYTDGKKTKQDWQMFGICILVVRFIERPLAILAAFGLMGWLAPEQAGVLKWFETEHLFLSVVLFIMIEELLHGWAHNFTHARRPKNRFLTRIQNFYRGAHRPHHMNGGNDGKGQISATHAVVSGWGWMLGLPNVWFGYFCVYFGLFETWLIGMMIKTLWGLHVHANLNYDVYLLNHPNLLISKTMYALAHVFTFPNQHRQHHSRGRNSAKNMNNFLALYDWLLWDKLVIEKTRPEMSGWKQREKEQNVLYRYLYRKV